MQQGANYCAFLYNYRANPDPSDALLALTGKTSIILVRNFEHDNLIEGNLYDIAGSDPRECNWDFQVNMESGAMNVGTHLYMGFDGLGTLNMIGGRHYRISDPQVANPTVTLKELGAYTLQLEASDGELTDTDTVQIVLYADSCEHTRNQSGFMRLPGDTNDDCAVDFLDLANLGMSWLEENYTVE